MVHGSEGVPKDSTLRFWKCKERRKKLDSEEQFVKLYKKKRI
jgi:hypothetical protein